MKNIEVKMIAHSIHPGTDRELVTMQLRYPRFIHAEFMTHRVFSRNASSSRAVPIKKMIEDVMKNPAMPVSWGSNKPGMQAGEECTNPVFAHGISPRESLEGPLIGVSAKVAWLGARNNAVAAAIGFANAGYHKQIVNRLLEPFGHISVVVTATEWHNFFALRCHPDADPTMRALAEEMRLVLEKSTPRELGYGEWHLPYVTDEEVQTERGKARLRSMLPLISAARCARVSYLNHDGTKADIAKDIELAHRLRESCHMSPFEHQAGAAENIEPGMNGNLIGWIQYRKLLEAGWP